MSLQDIVQVTIEKQTASISRRGFGTPMIMSTEADVDDKFATTAKIYTSLDGLGPNGDDYDTDGITYKKAAKLFSQNPKVQSIYIGKRALPPLKTVELTPIVKNSTAYAIVINGSTFTFTSDATATAAEIIQGLLALINAGTEDVLASDQTTYLEIEKAATPGGVATAGIPFYISFDRTLWTAQDTTADPGIATDLASIRTNVDGNDEWYCALIDSSGEAEITAMAAAIEPLLKIFLGSSFDADVITAVDTDLFSVLQALNYARTALVWNETPDEGPECAWAGRSLPFDPGSITWNLLSNISGIAASELTPSELTYLAGKNGNRFVEIAGQTVPQEGKMIGGEWIDVTRGIDFCQARLEENIFGRLVNLPKISFTDLGIAVIEAEVAGVMSLCVGQGIFTADPAPTVTVPLAADVDANDRANRLLPDVNFSAQLAGAIHQVEVNGVVTV
jgi:hypothetical protein